MGDHLDIMIIIMLNGHTFTGKWYDGISSCHSTAQANDAPCREKGSRAHDGKAIRQKSEQMTSLSS